MLDAQVGHTGSAPGIGAEPYRFLDGDVTVTVLATRAPGPAGITALLAANRLHRDLVQNRP